MTIKSSSNLQRVAILAIEPVSLFELACAVELFALERPELNVWYHTRVVTLNESVLSASSGIQLTVEQVNSLQDFDLIIIPNWPVDLKIIPEALSHELKHAARAKVRILSFCSGAFLLGHLGLLNGKKATTHWRYAERFKQQFPFIKYVDNVLFTYDGTIGCSAGSAAALDLGLEVIRHDFTQQAANSVARRLVISAQRQGGQNQFVETPVVPINNTFAKALDWAMQNLSRAWSINTFAEQANMSRRTFDRKFSATFNTSAKAWVIAQRITRAKSLLEDHYGSIEQIAASCGFVNTSNFRHHFKLLVGISPLQYQRQFGRRERHAL